MFKKDLFFSLQSYIFPRNCNSEVELRQFIVGDAEHETEGAWASELWEQICPLSWAPATSAELGKRETNFHLIYYSNLAFILKILLLINSFSLESKGKVVF